MGSFSSRLLLRANKQTNQPIPKPKLSNRLTIICLYIN